MTFNPAQTAWFHTYSDKSTAPVPALRSRLRTVRELLDQRALSTAGPVIEQLIAGAPYDFRVLALSAEYCHLLGEYEAAIQVYDRLLAQQDSNTIWASKARSLIALNRFNRAADCFARATALSPKARITIEHADCLRRAGHLTQALSILQGCTPNATQTRLQHDLVHAKIRAETGHKQIAFELAARAAKTDESGEAIALARQNMPDFKTFLDLCFQTAGQISSSGVLAEISIDCPQVISTKQTRNLTQIADDPECTADQQARAHLALFRLYNANNDGFVALAHLRRYHSLSETIKPGYKRSYDSALFTLLTRLKFDPLPQSTSEVMPIFVTGLPKSDTQYAAEILSHAAGGGTARPLSLVSAVMMRLIRRIRANSNARYEISRENMLELQAELRSGLRDAAQGAPVIIDTAPLNFRWSGVLAAALPEARIIHMKHHHMCTGWALHTHESQDPTLQCQNDLKQLQAFQHRSIALMSHWEMQNIPRILSISSEALRRPSQATAHAMVNACQLKWSPHCEIQPPERDVSWQKYAAYLNPLRQMVPSPLNIFGNYSKT